MSTLESFQHTIAPADQWPVSDAWAYHDWHQSGNGDVAPFMREIATEFGAATSLADFERKAQMLNYVDHRAIFEGFNAHLWAPNSGRLLWMTQPAWPSTMWQIFSSDYDTQASYYGVKKAAETGACADESAGLARGGGEQHGEGDGGCDSAGACGARRRHECL